MKDISLPKLLLNTRFQLFASQKGLQFSVHMADDAFCISIAECSFFVGERRDPAFLLYCSPTNWPVGVPGGAVVKTLLANAGDASDAGSIPGSGRSPGEGMATHNSTLAWKIPCAEEPGGLQSMGSQRMGRD